MLASPAREIEALAPEAGEESRLAEERSAIQAGIKAGESLAGLDELLGGADGALAQLRQAARRIERGADDHPLLAEALASLDRALIEADEAEDRIRARGRCRWPADPERLEAVEARLFDIRGLARKHRVEADASRRAGRADARAARRDRGRRRAHRRARSSSSSEARAAFGGAAAHLSGQRADAAPAARPGGGRGTRAVEARFGALPNRDWPPPSRGRPGIDRVEFEVSTNPGAPFGALTRIASGGELSRFILALKVALAEAGARRR